MAGVLIGMMAGQAAIYSLYSFFLHQWPVEGMFCAHLRTEQGLVVFAPAHAPSFINGNVSFMIPREGQCKAPIGSPVP